MNMSNNKFIDGGKKYEFVNNVIGMAFFPAGLPEKIQACGQVLYQPNPYHISLVYIGKIIEKYHVEIPDFSKKIVDDFRNFIATNSVEFIGYRNEYRFVDRENIKTVIVMCEVSNLNKFFDLINEKYDLYVKYPTTHVTLYNIHKGNPGVWIMDSDEIDQFTVRIENPLGFVLQSMV